VANSQRSSEPVSWRISAAFTEAWARSHAVLTSSVLALGDHVLAGVQPGQVAGDQGVELVAQRLVVRGQEPGDVGHHA
jgi:hypothetical protein